MGSALAKIEAGDVGEDDKRWVENLYDFSTNIQPLLKFHQEFFVEAGLDEEEANSVAFEKAFSMAEEAFRPSLVMRYYGTVDRSPLIMVAQKQQSRWVFFRVEKIRHGAYRTRGTKCDLDPPIFIHSMNRSESKK